MARAAEDVTWAHAGTFTCNAAEQLAKHLTERSGGLSRAQFLSGGSEAVEVALKVALQYHHERGSTGRVKFIARRRSYHGSTLGTLAVSGNPERRSLFEPLLAKSAFVSACDAYRGKEEGESDEEFVARLAEELDIAIEAAGPDEVAGFIAEPVVGSTCGAVPAVPGYFRAVRSVCEKHGLLLILDDVMSGMGRSGPLFSHLEDGVCPDIVVIGKGLAAGYQPISGYLIAEHVYDAIASGSGILRNGQTHVNHPFACKVALEVQRVLEEDRVLEAGRARGAEMRSLLWSMFRDHPHVGDIRGRGAFLGVEFVADRRTKLPLCGGAALVSELRARAIERELLIYPGTGTADGAVGNHVLFAPPLVASPSEIAEMVGRFVEVVADSASSIDRAAALARQNLRVKA
jgi:adenosylmethionine-8-amino-7-oxononanoate aminotransferase